MKICDEAHDEIVFDNKYCPLCEALDNVKELEKEVGNLQDDLTRANDAVNNHGA